MIKFYVNMLKNELFMTFYKLINFKDLLNYSTRAIISRDLYIRDPPRFFDQVGHQTTNASIGNNDIVRLTKIVNNLVKDKHAVGGKMARNSHKIAILLLLFILIQTIFPIDALVV